MSQFLKKNNISNNSQTNNLSNNSPIMKVKHPSLFKKSRNKPLIRKKPLIRNRIRIRKFKENLKMNAITNLSDHILSKEEREILEMGLTFVPKYDNIDPKSLENIFSSIERNLKIKYYFKNNLSNRKTENTWKKSKASSWTPNTPLHPQLLDLINKLKKLLELLDQTTNSTQNKFLNPLNSTNHNSSNSQPTNMILSPNHTKAMNSLKNNKNIIIKKADKRGSVVILNKKDYIAKAMEHLSDKNTYKEIPNDENTNLNLEILSYLYFLEQKKYLSFSNINYLKPNPTPRTPVFYFLPKIHKENNPPRPIISGYDSPTDKISEFLTSILNPIAQAQPSYIRDSTHLIQSLVKLPPLPKNIFLVSVDISSLYTQIPHEEGIQTVMEFLEKHRDILPPQTPKDHIIKNFLYLILKNNYFKFLDKFFLQIEGTAMGTKVAPPYANIFLAKIEQQLISAHSKYIIMWRRFLDDILFIWQGNKESLDKFITRSNQTHPNLIFNFEYSPKEINFLDLNIYLDRQRKINTNIFRKKTDKSLILHFDSIHPDHIKNNIIYNETLRYKNNISNLNVLEHELSFLTKVLKARGYPKNLIKRQMARALLILRSHLLKRRENKKVNPYTNAIRYKCKYGPQKQILREKIRELWYQTITDKSLQSIFPNPPIPIITSNKNLANILVRTDTTKIE